MKINILTQFHGLSIIRFVKNGEVRNMLFDEKDLNALENEDARDYFKEVLQSYYGQNYRAAIVTLYSFVIYDLFIKLQTMANEGDKKAEAKVKEINSMISDDEKYSKNENEIIQFYKEKCALYFNKFDEDIDYLKNCRNKCAHLKVNDNSLYRPNDYHVRMLICSMFDNVLSVKAPFITDLFSLAQTDVEKYAATITYIANDGLDDAIYRAIKNKYLERMTYDSMLKSYKTFIRLLFVSDNEDCRKNAHGLYAFSYAITKYAIEKGYTQIFSESGVVKLFSRIMVDSLKEYTPRRNALGSLITKFPILMDLLGSNAPVFDYMANCALTNPSGLRLYKCFYPREEKTVYQFFLENQDIQKAAYTEQLYQSLRSEADFNTAQFMKIMIERIPRYYGFDEANSFMDSFKNHLEELSVEDIEIIMDTYRKNDQCVNRGKHSTDVAEINRYIEEHKKKECNQE